MDNEIELGQELFAAEERIKSLLNTIEKLKLFIVNSSGDNEYDKYILLKYLKDDGSYEDFAGEGYGIE